MIRRLLASPGWCPRARGGQVRMYNIESRDAVIARKYVRSLSVQKHTASTITYCIRFVEVDPGMRS